jgi:FG-GAP repeat
MMKQTLKFCLLVMIVALIVGCKVEITVPQHGTVVTESGDYSCKANQTCVIDVVDSYFDQLFVAKPDEGFEFSHWKNRNSGLCGGLIKPCHLATLGFEDNPSLLEILESNRVFYLEPAFANTWSLAGEKIFGEERGDQSGASVSLSADGNRLAIGAWGNKGKLTEASDVGQVRVFAWTGAAWQQLGSDIDGDEAGDRFGTSVSLSSNGNRLAIGAIWVAKNGERSGQVRVYTWSGTDWLQLGGDINGEAAYDQSGVSVSLSADGNRLAIGATDNQGTAYRSGHVRVYEWRSKVWSQLGEDIDGKTAGELSGGAVSLSDKGNLLAIGASFNSDSGDTSGAARVYAWSGTDWEQLGADIHGKSPYDMFGNSVSLSKNGNRLAIGAGQADYVAVYESSGNEWSQLGGDVIGGAADDRFGYAVSLSADGTRLAIGAQWADDNGYSSGQTSVYSWSDTGWRQLLGAFNGDAKLLYFGQSVSLSQNGARVAAGAPGIGGYTAVYEMTLAESPPPSVDPMRVNLLNPAHAEPIPQNNPATGCSYHPETGYGLRVDFDWTDAESSVGVAGYHLKLQGRRASKPIIDNFVTQSEYSFVDCTSYVTNLNASTGFEWTVQAEDNDGFLGPVNDEGYFVFELCYLDNGQPCGSK